MLLPSLIALIASARLVHSFTDTSPLFLFSTSELLTTSPQIVHADTVSQSLTSHLSKCPSDVYIIVTQPGVHAEDYKDRYAAPHLRKKIQGEDETIRSSMTVTDVLGDVNTNQIIRAIEKNCGAAVSPIDASTGSFTLAKDSNPRLIELEFPPLPRGEKRVSKLQENDAFLSSLLSLLPNTKFTVLYTTTASSSSITDDHHPFNSAQEPQIYEMDPSFSSQTHMGVKRDLSTLQKREGDGGNVTLPDVPLFEKYAYLSPGIFMGLLVVLPLFLILYVGVTGVASLQVSYAAFDREMGPAAHAGKKG